MSIYRLQKGSAAFLGLIVLAVAFIFLAYWVRSPDFPLRNNNESEEQTEEKRTAEGVKYRVEITNKGFVPGVVSVRPYDTITFINRDSVAHWPTSGDLDGERACPEFGQGRQLSQNEAYAIVFKEEGECAFFDQLNEEFSVGTIFIEKE